MGTDECAGADEEIDEAPIETDGSRRVDRRAEVSFAAPDLRGVS